MRAARIRWPARCGMALLVAAIVGIALRQWLEPSGVAALLELVSFCR
jgi:hypothetical protein